MPSPSIPSGRRYESDPLTTPAKSARGVGWSNATFEYEDTRFEALVHLRNAYKIETDT
jgi:hypothetical protein